MIDDGFVVTCATPINYAFVELRGVFQAGGLLASDRRHPALAFYSSLAPADVDKALRDDWIERTVLAVFAEEALKQSLTSGQIATWTADQHGERARDPRVLFAPSECDWHKTFATGRYIPVQGQPASPPSYVRARLWLKQEEWSVLLGHFSQQRGGPGHDFASSLGIATSTKTSSVPTVTDAPRVGRPPGTGRDRSDAPLVKELLRLFRSGEAGSRTEAAKLVAHQAAGNGTWESKVRRLQRAASRMEKNGA